MQNEIRRSAYNSKVRQDSGDKIVVGVNKFFDKETLSFTVHRVDPKAEEGQLRNLDVYKNSRDKTSVSRALGKLESLASTDENLMPAILDAVKAGATNGEISDVLREVFGEYKPQISF